MTGAAAADITGDLLSLAAAPAPDVARAVMRLSLLDWAGCALAGRNEAVARLLRAQVADAAGGSGAVTVIGGGRAAPAQAALVGGATSHALDYDDTHFAHIGHPSVAVLPAALAVAEARGRDLDAMCDAALRGAEASVRAGLWLGRGHYQQGFHQTATAGSFGAALAAGLLMGLGAERLRTALGLASTLASGLKNQFGTMGKPLNAGLAARAGVEAAQWAAAGMSSADDGLAGPQGFGETHHGAAAAVPPAPGGGWWIERVSHKFHACCHGLHAAIEALNTLRGPDPDAVARVIIATHPRWLRVCNIVAPRSGLECKFSYTQVAAMSLTGRDTAAVGSFDDACAADPVLTALRARVEVVGDDTLAETQARVVVHGRDGAQRTARHDIAEPLPLDDRQARVEAKCAALTGSRTAAQLDAALRAGDLPGLCALLGEPAG